MKTVAAFAFAVMFLAMPVHSADTAASFETVAEAADNLAADDGRCKRWREHVVCTL